MKKKPNSFKAMLKEQLSYQCIVLLDIALDWKFNFMDHLIFEINVNFHSTNIVETLVWYLHKEAARVVPTTTLLSSKRLLVVTAAEVNMLDITINVIR